MHSYLKDKYPQKHAKIFNIPNQKSSELYTTMLTKMFEYHQESNAQY
jgi:hypothetical protein